jgi:AcrR family transcriptional regulator
MAEGGPETLTVSEVAHRAAVNRTTAYQHFRTRDEVIGAVIARLATEVSRMLDREMPLGERIDHMVKFFLDHPEIARLWVYQMLSSVPLPNRDGWERFMKAMSALAASEKTQDGIDPEMLGHVLLAATLLWSLRARSGPESEAAAATERFIRELKRLLLFGVLKPEHWSGLVASIGKARAEEKAR